MSVRVGGCLRSDRHSGDIVTLGLTYGKVVLSDIGNLLSLIKIVSIVNVVRN